MGLIPKFVESGLVMNRKRALSGIVNDEGEAVAVLRFQLMPNIQSVQQISAASGVIQTDIFSNLPKHKLQLFLRNFRPAYQP